MAKATTPDNLALWNAFEKTDPAHTREFTRGGFTGTAVDPMYIVKRLTEKFGPCGVGWRLDVLSEQVYDGEPLFDQQGNVVGFSKVHTVLGELLYKYNGEWVKTSPQFGQTILAGQRNNGRFFTDEEAPKKSVTDCLSKCASFLGVSADIYLHTFDGNKYVRTIDPPSTADALANARATGGSRNNAADAKRVSAPAKPAPKADAPAKPKRGRKPKAAPTVDSGQAYTYESLPNGFAYWLPEQWSDFFDSVTDPAVLTAAICEMVKITELADDANTFEGLCKQASGLARKLIKHGTEEWGVVAKALQDAKGLLAAA